MTKHAFLAGPFKEWLETVPADEVVLVAGNHDQSIEARGVPDGLPCHYLQDERLELRGPRLWGTPWQPWFLDWAFNAPQRDGEASLAPKFDTIPAGTDIVVGHGPPRGYGDRAPRPSGDGRRAPARAAEAYGLRSYLSGVRELPARRTEIISASLVDDAYQPVHAVVQTEI